MSRAFGLTWALGLAGLVWAAVARAETSTQVELRGTLVRLEVSPREGGGYRLDAEWRDGGGPRRQALMDLTTALRSDWGEGLTLRADGARLLVWDASHERVFVWDGGAFRLRLRWGWSRVEHWDRFDEDSGAWEPDPEQRGIDGMPMLHVGWAEAGGAGSPSRVLTMGLDDAALARHREACRGSTSTP
jgi:hypothetical protein